jgi:hypothetical protein
MSNLNQALPNHEDVVAAIRVLKVGKKLRFKMAEREVSVVFSSTTNEYAIGVDNVERESVASIDAAVERAWHYIRQE